jgi:hypothetical protein
LVSQAKPLRLIRSMWPLSTAGLNSDDVANDMLCFHRPHGSTSDGPMRLHAIALQGFFGPYLSQSIPHTARGSAVPYHYGSFRPTTQVRRRLRLTPVWHDEVIRVTLLTMLRKVLQHQ